MPKHKRPGVSQRAPLLERIQEDIDLKLHRSTEDNFRFICDYDLKSILEKYERNIFNLEDWSPLQSRLVLRDCYHILGTLIVIGAFSQVESIRDLFYRDGRVALAVPKITDNELLSDQRTHAGLIKFLGGLPYALKTQFLQTRYVMKPHKLQEQDPNRTITIDQRMRLPFQEETVDIGAGGYGSVSRVVVPAHYFITDKNAEYRKETYYAIKRVTASEDFLNEVKNNGILKESLRDHQRVLKHHLSFIHGQTFNILLPLAQHGNLEVLLNGGFDPTYEKHRYKLWEEFPSLVLGHEKTFADLVTQFTAIADAVDYLHGPTRIDKATSVYLVHMDLKPDNILITSDATNQSSVGTWVLSDFGISVVKEEKSRLQKSTYLTVGDAYLRSESRGLNDRSHTMARRGLGTYQAPEIEGNRTASRKSDVWSLACMFSEIIMFGIGGADLLKKYRDDRCQDRRGCIENMFYREKSGVSATESYSPENFEVHPAVREWCRTISSHVSSHTSTMKHCANIVLETLIIDVSLRPDCRDFLKSIDGTNQVSNLVARPSSSRRAPIVDLENSPSAILSPSTSKSDQRSLSTSTSKNDQRSLSMSTSRGEMEDKPLPLPPLQPSSPSNVPARIQPQFKESGLHSLNNLDVQSNTLLDNVSSWFQIIALGDAKTAHAVDVSVCPTTQSVIWLCKSGDSQFFVLATIKTESRQLERDSLVLLPNDVCWEQIEIASSHAGLYGRTQPYGQRTRICFYNIQSASSPTKVYDETYSSEAGRIAISTTGIGVLKERKKLHFVHADSNQSNSPMVRDEFCSHGDLIFSEIAFSRDGNVLVAWCYGNGVEEIHCWRFDGRRKASFSSFRLNVVDGDPGVSAIFVGHCSSDAQPLKVAFWRHRKFHSATLAQGNIRIESTVNVPAISGAEICEQRVLFTLKKGMFKKKHQLVAYHVPFAPDDKSVKPMLDVKLELESQPHKISATVVGSSIFLSMPMLNGRILRLEYRMKS